MTVRKTISETSDGSLQSTGNEGTDGTWPHDFQVKARQGAGVVTDPGFDPTSGQLMAVGGWSQPENPTKNQMRVFQAWAEFLPEKGFILPSTDDLVTASIRMSVGDINYTQSANGDSIQGWTYPATFPLAAGSWRDIEALTPEHGNFVYDLEYYKLENEARSGALFESGGEQFLINLATTLGAGVKHQNMWATYTSMYDFPTKTNGFSRIIWINPSNKVSITDAFKPTIITRSQQKHALNAVGGSSIQTTHGTAVFLRYDRSDNSIRLFYQRQSETVPTQIAKIPTTVGESADFFQIGPGYQTFALTRDDSNNLYVVGMRGALQGQNRYGVKYFNVMGFKWTGNHVWSVYSPTQCGENSLDAYWTHRALPNNFSAVWIPGSDKGSAGQLAILYAHRDGQWARNQFGLYVAYAGWFRGDATPGKNNGVAFADITASSAAWRPANSVATGLDAIADVDRVRFGTFMQAAANSDTERSAAGVALTPSNHVPAAPQYASSSIIAAPHDPDAKIRIPHMGDGVLYYCVVRHGVIEVHRKSDDLIYQTIDLTKQGLTGFPSQDVLQHTQAWDVIMDSADANWFWIYYRDATNNRLIRKVKWNFQTNELQASFQFTPAPLGPSGAKIVAMRLPRQKVQTSVVLLDVALVDGALNPLPLICLRDTTMNKIPDAPTLAGFNYFNAIQATDVNFTFNDVAPTDYCTLVDVQVRRTDNGTVVYSPTGATPVTVDYATRKYKYTIPANTLSNDTTYQIRVRTYDAAGAVGAWSDWLAFTTTSTGGGVIVTQPAADNPPLDRSSIQVSWQYSNSNPAIVQNGYRIRVFNNDTNAIFSDTALVNSTATTRQITGLWSDQQYRIEVSVLDSTGAMSGAGVRLVKASYNNPAVPSVILETNPGFLRIRVTNPPPSGENPPTTSNQIARKLSTDPDTAYVIIGTCPPNGAFDDYTVASKGQYVYKARGVA